MAGHLLFVILMISSHESQVQALLSPTLTVSTAVISETDSVTLRCQAPASASVYHCYFYTGEQQRIGVGSCLQRLTGTELLLKSHQSSPAEVKVRCFYTVKYGDVNSPSPHSNPSTITIQTLLPPTLTVSTAVTSETDSVTLRCQAPASASVYHCYFYTGEQQSIGVDSCLQRLTGTELLLKSHQSLPAEVKVRCFYTVKYGSVTSPHSNPSSITIQSQKPEMSVQHFDGTFVLIMCLLPGSVKDDKKCNLYFGEASRPVRNQAVMKKSISKTKQRLCQFYVAADDFLWHLHFVQQKDASCDYTLEREPDFLSPRSDRYNMKDILEKESPVTVVKSLFTTTTEIMEKESTMTDTKPSPTITMAEFIPTTSTAFTSTSSVISPSGITTINLNHTTNLTSTTTKAEHMTSGGRMTAESCPTTHSASIYTTSGNSPSGTWTLTVVSVIAGFGVTVGVILLALTILRSKRRNDRRSPKRSKAKTTDYFVCMTNTDHGGMSLVSNDGAYSVITSVAGVRCTADAEKLNREEFKHGNSDVYHVYATISEERATPVPQDMTYSMLQAH